MTCRGDIADDGEMAFDSAKIKRAFDEAEQKDDVNQIRDYRPPVIFLSVDPTGEGSSKFAIHTDYYKGNRQFVSSLFFYFNRSSCASMLSFVGACIQPRLASFTYFSIFISFCPFKYCLVSGMRQSSMYARNLLGSTFGVPAA